MTPTRIMIDVEKQAFGRWQKCVVSNPLYVPAIVDKILKEQPRYEAAAKTSGIPFWLLGCLHYRESSLSFSKHLHNGDSLTARTVHVPSGRPVAEGANPPGYSWEESAADALSMRGFEKLTDWDIVHCLIRAEAWNGFGYRKKGVPSPYIWSFTDQYVSGKFVADGKYDPLAKDAQPGVAALMLELKKRGVIPEASLVYPA